MTTFVGKIHNMTATENNISPKIFNLPEEARLWIYQSTRPFNKKEETVLKSQLNAFTAEWTAHSKQLCAAGDILYNQFIVLAVDENQAGASGCSIDKSVKFMQGIENQYDVQLFERMNFAWLDDETVKTIPSSDFKRLYTEGVLTGETLVFDNLITSVKDLKANWLKPLGQSWHKRFV
jgi:hypothetical protein